MAVADLVLAASPTSPALLDDMTTAARLIGAARSPRTIKEYRADWQRFAAWAVSRGLTPENAQPEHIAGYIGHLVDRGYKDSTITRAVYSLVVTFEDLGAGDDNPARHPGVKRALKGMRRTVKVARKKARPITTTELGRMSSHLPDSAPGHRDRAILLIGFAAALRRSEIAALNVEDIVDNLSGLEITIRSSKTDQEGEGRTIPIAPASDPACCPVLAWRAWRTVAQLDRGPAFVSINRHGTHGGRLSSRAVTNVIDKAAVRAGVSTDLLSAHSLRAGYVTTAAQRGHSERAISNVSRHASVAVLRGYVRRATIWQDSATDLGW